MATAASSAMKGLSSTIHYSGRCIGRGPLSPETTLLMTGGNFLLGRRIPFRPRGIAGSVRRRGASGVWEWDEMLIYAGGHAGLAAHSLAGKGASKMASHLGSTPFHLHRHSVPLDDDGPLEHMCRWVLRKLFPHDERDPLSFLPDSIHKYIHAHEPMAVLVLREATLLFIVFLLISNRVNICRWLHRAWLKGFKRHVQAIEEDYNRSMFSALSHPFGFSLSFLIASRIVRLFGPFMNIVVPLKTLRSFQGIVLIIASVWFFLEWKRKTLEHYLAKKEKQASMVAIDKLVSLLIYTLGFAATAEVTGIAFKSIIAIGGASSFAVGFASRAVISNFVGGIMLYINRPFSIGEHIKAGNHAGQVLDIGFYTTKLLGPDLLPIYIPNDSFSNLAVKNLSRTKVKLLDITLTPRTQYVISVIDQITADIEAMMKSHPLVDLEAGSCYCVLKSVGHEFSELNIFCAVKKTSSETFYKLQQEIIVKSSNIIIQAGGQFGLMTPLLGA